jgi:hypothetical protein
MTQRFRSAFVTILCVTLCRLGNRSGGSAMKIAEPILPRLSESYALHATKIRAIAEEFHYGKGLETMERIAQNYERMAVVMHAIESGDELELMRDWQP